MQCEVSSFCETVYNFKKFRYVGWMIEIEIWSNQRFHDQIIYTFYLCQEFLTSKTSICRGDKRILEKFPVLIFCNSKYLQNTCREEHNKYRRGEQNSCRVSYSKRWHRVLEQTKFLRKKTVSFRRRKRTIMERNRSFR